MKSYARYSYENRDAVNVVCGILVKVFIVTCGIVLKRRLLGYSITFLSLGLGLPCLGLLVWFQHKQRVKMKGIEGEGQLLHLPLSLTLSSPLAPLGFPFPNCEGSVLTLLYLCPPSLKNPLSDSNCPFVCDIFCRDLD